MQTSPHSLSTVVTQILDISEPQNQIRPVVFDMHKQNRAHDLHYSWEEQHCRWNCTSEILLKGFCECFMQGLHTRPPPSLINNSIYAFSHPCHECFTIYFIPIFPIFYPSVTLHTFANTDVHSNSYQKCPALERVSRRYRYRDYRINRFSRLQRT